MILSKIKIHPLFYFVTFISLITGNFKTIKIFTILIIVHELGHIVSGMIMNWQIEKIIILPFGGITIFNTKINKNIFEEIIVALTGPLFQIIFFILFENYLIKELHYFILLFNLLPIYPLDGYKILKNIIYLLIPFKYANILTLIISFIIEITILFHYHNLTFYLIVAILLIRGIDELYKQDIIFNKFMLERYLYKFNFKKEKIIKNKESMMYNKRHLFKQQNKLIKEHDYLHKMFDKSCFLW